MHYKHNTQKTFSKKEKKSFDEKKLFVVACFRFVNQNSFANVALDGKKHEKDNASQMNILVNISIYE